jgi:hypothetical protein
MLIIARVVTVVTNPVDFSARYLFLAQQAFHFISTDFSAYPPIVQDCTDLMTVVCRIIGRRNGTNAFSIS